MEDSGNPPIDKEVIVALRYALDRRLDITALEDSICSTLRGSPAALSALGRNATENEKAVETARILSELLTNGVGSKWAALRELGDVGRKHGRGMRARQLAAGKAFQERYSDRHIRRIFEPDLLPVLANAFLQYVPGHQQNTDSHNSAKPQGYRVERIETEYRFKGRKTARFTERWTIRANEGGVSSFSRVYEPLTPGVTLGDYNVSVGGDATLERLIEADDGIQTVTTGIGPLSAGEPALIVVDVELNRPIQLFPFFTLSSLQPAQELKVICEFDRSSPPAAVWRVDGWRVDRVDALSEGPPLTLTPRGRIVEKFTNLHPKLHYGLGWRWDEVV